MKIDLTIGRVLARKYRAAIIPILSGGVISSTRRDTTSFAIARTEKRPGNKRRRKTRRARDGVGRSDNKYDPIGRLLKLLARPLADRSLYPIIREHSACIAHRAIANVGGRSGNLNVPFAGCKQAINV